MQFRRCWCPFGGKGHGYEIIRDYFLLGDFNLYVIFTILAVVLNIQAILFLKQRGRSFQVNIKCSQNSQLQKYFQDSKKWCQL